MTDYELIKSKNYYEIWSKYRQLMMKFYMRLSEHKIYAFEDFDDFASSCYEVVVQAVDSIKLEKIKKPDTWTIYIQLYRYLGNYTTRKVIPNYYKEMNQTSYDAELNAGSYEDDHSIFEKSESFNQIMQHLTEHEKILLKKYIESGGKRSQAREAVLNKIRELSN